MISSQHYQGGLFSSFRDQLSGGKTQSSKGSDLLSAHFPDLAESYRRSFKEVAILLDEDKAKIALSPEEYERREMYKRQQEQKAVEIQTAMVGKIGASYPKEKEDSFLSKALQ
ncbi:hypothetical protein CCZ01_00250 [Helicobacter monodelphidis]|nr:hypothetical protein CCZ01_00250 [Helicobacter sp. 15-1451]